MPRPDLIVLLQDAPAAIHRRKPEFTVSQLEASQHGYERICRVVGGYVVVDVSGGVEAAQERLFTAVGEFLAAPS